MSKNAMGVDLSRQMKKKQQSTSTHPAFQQIWDMLFNHKQRGVADLLLQFSVFCILL
jgi:hypothetical protein